MLRRVITDLCQHTDGRAIGIDQLEEGISVAIECVRTAISEME